MYPDPAGHSTIGRAPRPVALLGFCAWPERSYAELEICRTRFLPRGDQVVSLGSIRWVATLACNDPSDPISLVNICEYDEASIHWYTLICIDIHWYTLSHCELRRKWLDDWDDHVKLQVWPRPQSRESTEIFTPRTEIVPRGRRVSLEMQWFDLRLQDGAPQL